MRALTLAEVTLFAWTLFLIITSAATFITEGLYAWVFQLVEGRGALLTFLLILILLIDSWRIKKRRNLLQKGKLKPGQLF
ncbi:hypothetical protein ACQCVH_11035 [Bacillus infantis]|uniref:hypothetical protein n=1 Tax=Bacillus infantis TaxID=324767 RepID=UPI003CF08B9C